MQKSLSRSLQCRQIYLNIISVGLNGVPATPVVSGYDSQFVLSVVDNGTGDYTITFKDIAQRSIQVIAAESATDGLYARASVVTSNSVRVLVKAFAGTATDGAFTLTAFWHGAKTLY